MNGMQLTAYQHPCYEAEETLNPKFHQVGYIDTRHLVSLIVTTNIGEE